MSQVVTPEVRPADDPRPFLSHPDALYEVVDGQVQELPPMGTYAVRVATLLAGQLLHYLREHPIGILLIEGLLVLDRDRNLRRRPDIAFVSVDRWPADRPLPEEGDIEVVPDIAIEILSPNDLYIAVNRKLVEYFDVGVRQVWLVDPAFGKISVYASPTEVRIHAEGDILEGEPLLPGSRLDVASVFRRTLG